jgi:hypothetical protein
MMQNNTEVKDEMKFHCWMILGTGTPRNILMSHVVGENWMALTLKQTAEIFLSKYKIDVLDLHYNKVLNFIKDTWENETGKSFLELRRQYAAEEYGLVCSRP